MDNLSVKIPITLVCSRDIVLEQSFLHQIIEALNNQTGKEKGFHLQMTSFSKGFVEITCEKDISRADFDSNGLVVMLLWKKWNCAGGYTFDEQYNAALARNREIRLYFHGISDDMLADPGGQLYKVLQFRNKIETESHHPYQVYEEEGILKNLLISDLSQWLSGFPYISIQARLEEVTLEKITLGRTKAIIRQDLEKPLQTSENQYKLDDAHSFLVYAGQEMDAGHLTQAEEYFARAISICPDPGIIRSYGIFLESIGFLEKAKEKYLQLRRIGENDNNKVIIADADFCLGIFEHKLGNHAEAITLAFTALNIFNAESIRSKAAAVDNFLGLLFYKKNELEAAERFFKQALNIYTELGQIDMFPAVCVSLGRVYSAGNNLPAARSIFEEALSAEKKIGNQYLMGEIYACLADLNETEGSFDKAVDAYRQSLALFRELGKDRNIAEIYGRLGNIYARFGVRQFAEKIYNEAISIYERISDNNGKFAALKGLGESYFRWGKLEQAGKVLEKAVSINLEMCRPDDLVQTYFCLGKIYFGLDRLDQAEEKFLEAVKMAKVCGQSDLKAQIHIKLGEVYYKRKEYKAAENTFNLAVSMLENGVDYEEKSQVYGFLGDVYSSWGKLQQAGEMYKMAISVNKAAGLEEYNSDYFYKLGEMYESLEQLKKSKGAFLQALKASNDNFEHQNKAVSIYTKLGSILHRLGDVSGAKHMYLKAIKLGLEAGSRNKLAEPCTDLGHIYFRQGDLTRAEHVYNEAIRYRDNCWDTLVSVYSNLGRIYIKWGDIKKAGEMNERAREIVIRKLGEKDPGILDNGVKFLT